MTDRALLSFLLELPAWRFKRSGDPDLIQPAERLVPTATSLPGPHLSFAVNTSLQESQFLGLTIWGAL